MARPTHIFNPPQGAQGLLITCDATVPLDWNGFAAALAAIDFDWRTAPGKDGLVPCDLLMSSGRDARVVADFLVGLLRENSLPIDWQGVPMTVRDALVSIDWLTAMMPTGRLLNADWTALMGMLGTPGVEWRIELGSGAMLPAEILAGRGKDGLISLDLLAGTEREGRLPMDWQGIILTLREGTMPVDWVLVPAREGCTAADWQVFIGVAGSGGIEWRVSPGRDAQMPVDALVALAREAGVHISITCPSGRAASAEISWEKIIEKVSSLGIDYRIEVTKAGVLELTWQGKIVIISIGKLKNVQMLASEIDGLVLKTGRMAKVSVEVGTPNMSDIEFIS